MRVNSPSGTITDTDSFTFDAAYRMLTAVSDRYANTVTKTYDDAGRLEDESLTIGSGMSEKTYTVSRKYNDRSQVWKLTYPDTTVVERIYTDRGQLNTVKYGATTIDTRAYDVGGRLSTSTYGNGVVATYGYRSDSGDKDNQIDSIDIVKSATTIDAFDYAYDANKNVVSESRTGTMPNYGWDTDDSGSSGYDDDDRLKYWERNDSNLTQEWSLSLVGDWNSITENTVATTHTQNDVHELTGVGSNNLSYDANGNMTTNHNGDSYSWDFNNRMTGADTDATAGDDVTFEYDALGRRVRKDDGTNDIVYVYAGQQVIAEYAFNTVASSPTEQYAYGSYIDEPIIKDGTLSSGTGIVYYHHDRRFSVVALTDSTGNAVERYAYSPYGEMSVFNGSGTAISATAYANTTTFTGRDWNTETELYYFRARYFDAETGIFVGRDPLGYVDGTSLYRSYFNPSDLDPSGQWKKISESIYEADRCHDNLRELAFLITQDESDWVCIWPTGDWLSPNLYPVASIGDRADVSNLISKSKSELIMHAPATRGDLFMAGVKGVFGPTEWKDGEDAARKIKTKSKEGKEPIGKLCVAGHCLFLGLDGGLLDPNAGFYSLDLFTVATEKKNSSNTYKSSSKNIGPPKCWFTTSANFYGYGCGTGDGWANIWKEQIAHKKATVHGTSAAIVIAGTDGTGAFATLQGKNPAPEDSKHRKLSSLLSAPGWVAKKGNN